MQVYGGNTHAYLGPDHPGVRNAWNSLLSNAYKCNLVIENGGSAANLEAQTWYYYNVVDLFGHLYRGWFCFNLDPKVWSRSEATDFIIAELEAVVVRY
jgi:hypothetical protein